MSIKSVLYLLMTLPGLMLSSPLFDSGKSLWRIWQPSHADQVEIYAAEEFQTAVKKISGVTLPILRSAAPEGTSNVIIAGLDSYSQLPASLNLKPDTTEELAYRTQDGNLYLCGNCSRATLYAVYAFLRRELDARWYWPGDDGEFLPKKDRFQLGNLVWHDRPAFRFREMTPCGLHYHEPTEIWMGRNFLNGGSRTQAVRDKMGFYRLDCTHSVSLDKKMFSQHPEWFSLINGKRSPEGLAGCWSNPEFTKWIVEKHVKMIRDRNMNLVNAYPADIDPRCECPECTKNPDSSSRWFDYYAKLIAEIRKQCPEVLFAGIAYQEYRRVPTTKVRSLEYVEYCQYNRCYVHRLDDPTCDHNQKSMAELRRWQDKAPMGIYGYEFDIFNTYMYVPFWNMLQEEMRLFKKMNLVRMKTELLVVPWKPVADNAQLAFRLPYYIYTQLLWNPNQDMDQLLQDFCRHVYGPAATIMLAYHKRMAQAWDAMKLHLTRFSNNPTGTARYFLNDKLALENLQTFKDAIKATEGQTRARQNVLIDQTQFQKWLKPYQASKKNTQAINASLLSDDPANFSQVARFSMINPKKAAKPAEARVFWSKEALHVQVTAMEPDMSSIRKGITGKHDVDLWQDDNVEIFIGTALGAPYRHLAANLAGGSYDAINTDISWNPTWQTKTRLLKDRWIMDIRIPFKELGIIPKPGDQWQIVIIRNDKPASSGFPTLAYHDISAGATLRFSPLSRPDRRIAVIASPRLNTGKNLQPFLCDFLSKDWQPQGVNGVKAASSLDLEDARLILYETCWNPFPQELFRERLVPAVKNGAVLVFSCYFNIQNLPRDFNDPTFKVEFIEKPDPSFKPTFLAQDSFGNTPHDIRRVITHSPSGSFKPAYPEAWVVLAKQRLSDGTQLPFVMARPLGKGMVVLAGDMARNIEFMDNLFEYNKAIKR